ncbi:FAD-dependent oxidoreductase [Ornithinibacillus sp. L9]|uniref:FAD-dependent oxidoreductase n=1 Tax=Ornithinibacillus caprae TaxID=2678566 RepID=A0A6N8FG66_9BACI|nr:FAD-dependent oxidoreductase [Ornithinibacillus caprae]MUK87676.1 FAD-dependent oxidoreductase [Ornithinibacillus caprae]
METADAIIIGGGVIGTSIAYYVAKTGRSVILLEKGEIGAQTSAACDKAIFLQSKKPGFPVQLAKKSRSIYENLEEELGASIEFKPNGGMIVIEQEEHLEVMKKFVKKQQKAGIDVKLLDRNEALARQPSLSHHIVGATYSKEDAEVNPLLLTQAFAEAAKRHHAEIRPHTAVINITTKNQKVTGVQTTNGSIASEIVINATGPFAPKIAEMAGVSLTIMPRRGAILITEKLKPTIFGNVLCSQYITAKHNEAQNPPPFGIGLSLGQTDSGNVLIGASREFNGYHKSVDAKVLSAIAAHASRLAPALRNTRIIRTMVGFRPYTIDGLPIIDEAPDVKGFFIAAGHEGDGIALAPITGHLVTSLIDKRAKEQELLQPLKLNRSSRSLSF